MPVGVSVSGPRFVKYDENLDLSGSRANLLIRQTISLVGTTPD